MQKLTTKICLVFVLGLLLSACGAKKTKHQPLPTKGDSIKQEQIVAVPRWRPPLGDSIKHEMRAVWLTLVAGLDWPHVKADTPDGVRRQQESLERILDRLVEDGYNTVFFQARQSGSVNYYSDEPFNKVFTSNASRPAYDPLAFAVEACHKRGLKIHAWIVTYPLVSKTPRHPIVAQHPDWAIAHQGTFHLDPGSPKVRTHIASIVSDIARRYNVDGIHFDYFRYPEEAGRYNDTQSYKKYGNGMDKASWRRQNLTKQLEEVQDSLQRVRPDVQVSVAPLGKLRKLPDLGKPHGWTAYDDVYQDPETWAKQGLVDFLVPMMYYRDHLYEPFLIDWQERVGRYVPVIAGLAPYRTEPTEKGAWPISVIKDQIEIARKYKAGGISMFREGNVSPRRPYLRTLIQEQFAHLALYPELARGKAQKPDVPRGLSLSLTGKHLTLSWMMPEQKVSGVTYRVWCTTTHADGSRESYLVKDGLLQTQCTMLLANFRAGDKMTFGVEAVNSFGVATPSDVSVDFRFTPQLSNVLPAKTK